MPLSLDFSENVDAVVVSKRSGHLVVVHGQMILLDSPQLGQPCGIDNLEDPRLLVLPGDVAGVPLLGVVEQLLQKVPQQPAVGVQLGGLPVGGGRGLRRGCRRRPGGSSLRRRCG